MKRGAPERDTQRDTLRTATHAMSLINVSVKHERTLDDARTRMQGAVGQIQGGPFAHLVQAVDWAPDRSGVRVTGRGFFVDMRVDDQFVHVTGDIALLGGLLGGPFAAAVRRVIEQAFPKRLPGG